MADGRPYADAASLIAASDKIWSQAVESDILEAFSAHPKIGDKSAAQHGGVCLLSPRRILFTLHIAYADILAAVRLPQHSPLYLDCRNGPRMNRKE